MRIIIILMFVHRKGICIYLIVEVVVGRILLTLYYSTTVALAHFLYCYFAEVVRNIGFCPRQGYPTCVYVVLLNLGLFCVFSTIEFFSIFNNYVFIFLCTILKRMHFCLAYIDLRRKILE